MILSIRGDRDRSVSAPRTNSDDHCFVRQRIPFEISGASTTETPAYTRYLVSFFFFFLTKWVMASVPSIPTSKPPAPASAMKPVVVTEPAAEVASAVADFAAA